MTAKKKNNVIIPAILVSALAATGLFFEATAAVFSVVIGVLLVVVIAKNKKIVLYANAATATALLFFVFYLLTGLWSRFPGDAFIGFVKNLPLFFFVLLLMQTDCEKGRVLRIVAHFGAVSTALSAFLMQLPPLKDAFSVAGRLAGFFQYPNVYALFALVCAIILLTEGEEKWYEYIEFALLLFGILYSGSRSVFVLSVLALPAALIFAKNKKTKLIGGGILLLGAVAAALAALLTKGENAFSRFVTSSLSSSTLMGRLLYVRDALPEILKNPFGHGYLSYCYGQQGFQTGVYSVRFMHCDLLQLFYDIGWLPALVFVFACGRNVFKKGTSVTSRIIVSVIFLHSLFDFDLQYSAALMLLFFNFDCREGKKFEFKSVFPFALAGAALTLVALFMSFPLTFTLFGNYAAAESAFSSGSDNNARIMESDDMAASRLTAERLISEGKATPLAYETEMNALFAEGDIGAAIDCGKAAIDGAPYVYDYYESLAYVLTKGIELYGEAGDDYSREYCENELLALADRLKTAADNTSTLGKKIKDRLPSEFNGETLEAIKVLTP